MEHGVNSLGRLQQAYLGDRGSQSGLAQLICFGYRDAVSKLLRPILLLTILLAVPIVPFLIWGELFVDQLADWQQKPPGRWMLVAAVAGILASDIVLPVPSGPVCTLAGAQLGAMLGTLACWLGMTIGAVLAYALACRWGRPIAHWLASEADLEQLQSACQRNDVWMLLATRPLPVLAEACVLLVGLLETPWRRFLPTIAVSNLAIAAIYCWLGQYAADRAWLPLAVCISLAVPVALMLWARRRWLQDVG